MTEGASKIWLLVLILIATTVCWWGLSELAFHARSKQPVEQTKVPTVAPGQTNSSTQLKSPQDYDKATLWAKDILGLAVTFAGFLGVAAAAKNGSTFSVESAEGGIAGILAGATLLGVGGWPAPLGLVAVATGVAARAYKRAAGPATGTPPGS